MGEQRPHIVQLNQLSTCTSKSHQESIPLFWLWQAVQAVCLNQVKSAARGVLDCVEQQEQKSKTINLDLKVVQLGLQKPRLDEAHH